MQALTFATFGLKKAVSGWYRGRAGTGTGIKIAHGLSIWAIMFFSKFVFLGVINIVFGTAVEISSFVGLILIIGVMVILSRLIEFIDRRLGSADRDLTPLGANHPSRRTSDSRSNASCVEASRGARSPLRSI